MLAIITRFISHLHGLLLPSPTFWNLSTHYKLFSALQQYLIVTSLDLADAQDSANHFLSLPFPHSPLCFSLFLPFWMPSPQVSFTSSFCSLGSKALSLAILSSHFFHWSWAVSSIAMVYKQLFADENSQIIIFTSDHSPELQTNVDTYP